MGSQILKKRIVSKQPLSTKINPLQKMSTVYKLKPAVFLGFFLAPQIYQFQFLGSNPSCSKTSALPPRHDFVKKYTFSQYFSMRKDSLIFGLFKHTIYNFWAPTLNQKTHPISTTKIDFTKKYTIPQFLNANGFSDFWAPPIKSIFFNKVMSWWWRWGAFSS